MSVEMTKQVADFFGTGRNLLHLNFHNTHLEITISKAKIDQMREGHILRFSLL